MSETKINPGQFAQPDQAALDNLNGTAAVATRPQQAMSASIGNGSLAIKPSYLDIAYSVSKWNENDKFGNGAFVLDHEDEIAKQTKPLTVIVAGMRTYWQTYPQNDIARADYKFYANEAEALRAGEITQYPPKGSNGRMPTVLEACDLNLYIQRPEGCTSTRFVMKLGDHWYAPARFGVNKLWREIKQEITRAAFYEAGMRGVAPGEGRLDQYFMRLWTQTEKRADGKSLVHLRAAFVPGTNGPEPVPGTVKDALAALAKQVEEAMKGAASSGDEDGDVPPVATVEM